MSDVSFMEEALRLAAQGRGRTSPNPMVGALIVQGDKMVGAGWHRRCGGAHAEVLALRQAGAQARGATLYVNLEPCFHQGRTPPCVEAVLKSGVARVVIAMKDPNPLTVGKSIARMRRAGLQVKVGVLRLQAQQLNEAFCTFITQKRPFVVAKTAQTLDGKIATGQGDSKWITAASSRKAARHYRDFCDAIMVGVNTVLADDPRLTGSVSRKPLKKVIVDSHLRIPLNAQLFQEAAPGGCLVASLEDASAKAQRLRAMGVEVIRCRAQRGRVNLSDLLERLAQRQIVHLLIEGGATLIGAALKAGLVDKMRIYIAPKIFGDQEALNAIVGLKSVKVEEALALRDVQVTTIQKDILVEGYVHRHH